MSLLTCKIQHDGVSQNPIGSGAYVFRTNLIPHFLQYCNKNSLIFHIGSQPSSSPHIGTVITFAVAFSIAHRIRDRDVLVSLDVVDTAPSEQITINDILYQKSLRHTSEMETYMEDYKALMAALHKYWGVKYRIRMQAEFLDNPKVVLALKKILDQREELQRSLSPDNGCLGISSECPVANCGLANKQGIQNVYQGTTIKFYCPYHGEYTVDISESKGIAKLEFNSPLRNLLRAMVFASDEQSDWVRVTGADFAGYYQEQLLLRNIPNPLIILYAPLILDWSGAKVSKSRYVRWHKGGYNYLKAQGLECYLSFKEFKAQQKDLDVIFKEVNSWVDDPYKLFRSYSLEYIHSLFERTGSSDGDVAV